MFYTQHLHVHHRAGDSQFQVTNVAAAPALGHAVLTCSDIQLPAPSNICTRKSWASSDTLTAKSCDQSDKRHAGFNSHADLNWCH